MSNTVALVLAGGKIDGFGVLTLTRAKAALPFGGLYRVIDFALSNLSNSNIEHIGIIMQYLPASLIEHVGAGYAWDLHGYDRIVKIMPPFMGVGKTEWYKGTADALLRNLNFVYDLNPDNVLILSGEHVYQMNYEEVIRFHLEYDADATLVGVNIANERLSSRFGYLKADAQHRITFFKEKPHEFLSNFVWTGICVFKKAMLIEKLIEDSSRPTTHNLAADIIQPMVSEGARVYAYTFTGFWEYLEHISAYYETNLLLCQSDSPIQPGQWGILTNPEDRNLGFRPASHISSSATVTESIISPGCSIAGTVIRSVLSPGVKVEKDAIVEDSIIMHDSVVSHGAHLCRIISDKDALFEPDCIVGGKVGFTEVNPELPHNSAGLVVIGKGAVIGEKTKVEPGCQVYPQVDLRQISRRHFPGGQNIKLSAP
jgi:glucose-1-phosphate adenylyltransferase